MRQTGICIGGNESLLFVAVSATPVPREGPGVKAPLYVYSIDVSLFQKVLLVRDRNIVSEAATWKQQRVGWVGSNKISVLRDHVRDSVDRFLNDYLAVNPKH